MTYRKTLPYIDHEMAALWHNPGLFGADRFSYYRWCAFLFLTQDNGYEWIQANPAVILNGPWYGDPRARYTEVTPAGVSTTYDKEPQMSEARERDIAARLEFEGDDSNTVFIGRVLPGCLADKAGHGIEAQAKAALVRLLDFIERQNGSVVKLAKAEDIDSVRMLNKKARTIKIS